MTALLLLATLYLFAVLGLVFVIDLCVGVLFSASTQDASPTAVPLPEVMK